ncbi:MULTISPECIES: hypothetical protein [Subtercola]|uniref:RNA polymerase sigma-70 region 2 domain-containing protein n=1 Tax=Subtercola vilae TaxID=2056433 RepID=A0A4T2BZN5_9MICO|nr:MULTISPECIES: hypothetical protein [Subtercola]MEA9984172.1 hypothetical protein [Subtercola sp. RTI3]TIH37443.1 hypothetical protein D4765_08550 [Subtercola vilae]
MSIHDAVADDPPVSGLSFAADLLRRVAQGDHDAFGDFYDVMSARVHGIVCAGIDDKLLAEELTGEIFLEFWRSAPARISAAEPLRSVLLFAHRSVEERRALLPGASASVAGRHSSRP